MAIGHLWPLTIYAHWSYMTIDHIWASGLACGFPFVFHSGFLESGSDFDLGVCLLVGLFAGWPIRFPLGFSLRIACGLSFGFAFGFTFGFLLAFILAVLLAFEIYVSDFQYGVGLLVGLPCGCLLGFLKQKQHFLWTHFLWTHFCINPCANGHRPRRSPFWPKT